VCKKGTFLLIVLSLSSRCLLDPMRLLLVSLLFTSTCAVSVLGTEMWIDQLQDHFSFSTSLGTWKQRYFIDDTYVAKGASNVPLLFWVGNEGDVTDRISIMQTGLLRTAAHANSAHIVYAEHRYYGLSQPFGNYSLNYPNITHLTMENAMADYARLIVALKDNRSVGPVVAFGCSYGAWLTAWFKYRYPQYVYGAIASAGPVLYNSSSTAGGMWCKHRLPTYPCATIN
jgi:hypothetical protein